MSMTFSEFISNATDEEKRNVYDEVLAKATERQLVSFQPKGGMCATCRNVAIDCSGLPFYTMRVISSDEATGAKVVKCEAYDRVDDTRN